MKNKKVKIAGFEWFDKPTLPQYMVDFITISFEDKMLVIFFDTERGYSLGIFEIDVWPNSRRICESIGHNGATFSFEDSEEGLNEYIRSQDLYSLRKLWQGKL